MMQQPAPSPAFGTLSPASGGEGQLSAAKQGEGAGF